VSRLHRRIRPAGAAPAVPDCSAAKTFYDWNGDGCGDIRGTTERIEYLSDLGGHLPVVDAVLSDCPQGRRLRHHRRGDPVGFAKRRDEMEHVVRQLLNGPVCASQREAALVRVRFSNGAAKLNPPFSSSRSKLGRPHRRCHGRRWRTPASCPAVAMSRRRSRCESPIGAHDQGVDSPNMAGFQLDGSLDIRLQSH